MPWGEIGAVLAVLVLLSTLGHMWFSIVEGVLGSLKRLLGRQRPIVWHTLPPEQDKKENKDV